MEVGSRIACGLEGSLIFEYVFKTSKFGFLKYTFDLDCCLASVAAACISTKTTTAWKITEYRSTGFADFKTWKVISEYGLENRLYHVFYI